MQWNFAFHHRAIDIKLATAALTSDNEQIVARTLHSPSLHEVSHFIFHSHIAIIQSDELDFSLKRYQTCKSFITIINYAFKCSHLHLQPRIVFLSNSSAATSARQPQRLMCLVHCAQFIIIRMKLFHHCRNRRRWQTLRDKDCRRSFPQDFKRRHFHN